MHAHIHTHILLLFNIHSTIGTTEEKFDDEGNITHGEILLTEIERTTDRLQKEQRKHLDNHLTEFEKSASHNMSNFEKTTSQTFEKLMNHQKDTAKSQRHTIEEFYKLVKRQSDILENVIQAFAEQKTYTKERMATLTIDLAEIKGKVNMLVEEEGYIEESGDAK